jgi:DNA mismatch repair protein MutS
LLHRTISLLCIGLSLLTNTPSTLNAKEKKKKEEHLVKSLANEYMRAFAIEDDDGDDDDAPKKPEETTQPPEIITFTIQTGEHSYKIVNVPLIGTLSSKLKYDIGFDMLDIHVNQGKLPVQKTIDKTFIRSMELVYGGSEGKNSLVRDINYSPGIIAETAFAWACAQPSPDQSMIKYNQAMIKELVTDPQLFTALYSRTQKLAALEDTLFSFYTNTDKAFHEGLIEANFYPLFGRQSMRAMRWKTSFEKGAYTCFRLFLYAWTAGWFGAGAFATYKERNVAPLAVLSVIALVGPLLLWALNKDHERIGKVIIHIQRRMSDLAAYINTLRELHDIIKTHPVCKNNFVHVRYLSKLFENRGSEKMNLLLTILQDPSFKLPPSWSSFNGLALVAYDVLQEVKYELSDAIMTGGQLGALVSASRLYLDHQDTPVHYSFVEFVNDDRPYIGATNLWNPRLDAHKAVPSSFEMGGPSAFNMVLTGGNGLGKSTIMKGLLYAMLIAQTFGIAPADRLVMTPFSRMICHTNVTDNVAAGLSGFTAELAMKDTILKEYTLLKPNEFAITVFDELFKSTNPDDAAQLSKQLCRSLAQYKNGMSIIATHLAPVTQLETEGTHANYHPGSIPQGDGKPAKPTYTLEKGASFDHNAIALYNAGNK